MKDMSDKKLIEQLTKSLQALTGYAASMSTGCETSAESRGADLCARSEGLKEQVKEARALLRRVRLSKALPVHKGYLIRYIAESPDKAQDLIEDLGASTPERAIEKLEKFPGEWIIAGQLLSYDDPDLPEYLRKKDEIVRQISVA